MNIFISGASSGIGLVLAKNLDNSKNNLFLTASKKSSILSLKKEFYRNKNITLYKCNFANRREYLKLPHKILKKFKHIEKRSFFRD